MQYTTIGLIPPPFHSLLDMVLKLTRSLAFRSYSWHSHNQIWLMNYSSAFVRSLLEATKIKSILAKCWYEA